MNLVSKALFTSTLSFLLTLLLLVLPFFSILSRQNLTQTFHSLQFYEYLTPIIQSHCLDHFHPDGSLFSETMQNHIDEIITPEWVTYFGEMLLEEGHKVVMEGKRHQDLEIDLSLIKQNYLRVLEESDVPELIPHLNQTLPTTIPLSTLLTVSPATLDSSLTKVQGTVKAFTITIGAISLLLCFTVVLFVLFFPQKAILRQISYTTLITGAVLLSFSFIFHFGILSRQGLANFSRTSPAFIQKLQLVIGFLILEQAVVWWVWIGLAALAIGWLIRILTADKT